jgi:hypothetical protein
MPSPAIATCLPSAPQLLHLSDLPGWLDLRLHRIEAELPRYRGSSAMVVAGEHDQL